MSLNRRLAPAIAALLVLSVGACASLGDDKEASQADAGLPTEQYKVTVEQTPEQLALAPHATGLSEAQTAAIGEFAAQWRDAGQGEIAIRAPSQGDPTAVSRASTATQAALVDLGVPRRLIRVEGYDSAGDPRPPLLVSFIRYTAKGPDCNEGWDNLTSTGKNKVTGHFGCAVTANFAAQIANPRDLLQPTPSDPSDAGRRANVMGLYRKGDVTSSKQDEQSNGAVSRAVQ